MSQEDQKRAFQKQCKEIVEDIEVVYRAAFDRLSTLTLGERKIAKLAQLLLISKESAISPFKKVIENDHQQS